MPNVAQIKDGFQVGDTFLLICGKTTTATGFIEGYDKEDAICHIVQIGAGVRPEDEIYVTNRSDTPFAISRIVL